MVPLDLDKLVKGLVSLDVMATDPTSILLLQLHHSEIKPPLFVLRSPLPVQLLFLCDTLPLVFPHSPAN